jgi:hypothetical protein
VPDPCSMSFTGPTKMATTSATTGFDTNPIC